MKYGSINLGQVEAVWNKFGGEDGVRRFLSGELVVKVVSGLLRFSHAFSSPAITRFVAAVAFGPNNPDNIRFFLGGNFKKVMLPKIELDIPAAKLAIHRLEVDAHDPEIMVEMGKGKRIVKLAQLYAAIRGGQIPKDGSTTVAYVFGNDGNIWAVSVFWDSFSRDWGVVAYSVGNPSGWSAGCQVLSQV